MENINSGYVALFFVVILFFALQLWWISMTIRNNRNERILLNADQTEDMKHRLERIFLKTARQDDQN